MKGGEDQHAGMLGIGLTTGNPHIKAAELAAVRPGAPAAKAGLKKGDRIVEIDGKPIRTQTDLRFAIGPRYGGDRVKLGIERGNERLDRELELIGKLPEFRHAFLGILPLRPAGQAATNAGPVAEKPDGKEGANKKDSDEKDKQSADDDNADDQNLANAEDEKPSDAKGGVTVRMVYAGSPAEQAGLQAGDRIIKMNDAAIGTIAEAITELNNAAPGSEVALQYVRAGKPMDLKLTASRLPTSVPAELPAAYEPLSANNADTTDAAKSEAPAKTKGESSELKLPEFPQQCRIYLPAMHDDRRELGVLLWLHAPGKANSDDVIRDWQSICDRDGVILVIPSSTEEDRWDRTELEYLARLVERVIGQHKIDSNRVVVYGEAGGGAMAWLLGVSGRHIIRGVATSAAPLPRQLIVPSNEPMQRQAIFAAIPGDNDAAVQIAQGLQKFSEAGYPVTTLTGANGGGQLPAAQREELARWIDTLDCF
jgi:serine protease Do